MKTMHSAQRGYMKKTTKEQLLQSVFQGEGLDQIADKAAIYLNNPIVIISNAFNIITYSRCFSVDDYIWNNAVNRGYITLEFAATLNHWDEIKDPARELECVTVNQINKLRRRFYKLKYQSRHLGYLNVTEVNGDYDDLNDEYYELVSQIFAREIFIQQKMLTTSMHSHNEDIVMELSNESYLGRVHFLQQVSLSTLDLKTHYQIICSDLKNFLSYNADQDVFKSELLALFTESTIIISEGMLIVLQDCNHQMKWDSKFEVLLGQFLKKYDLIFGLSDCFEDLYQFKSYENQARKAISERVYLNSGNQNWFFYDQVKPFDLLIALPKETLNMYCNQKIREIADYDRLHESEYLATITTYLEQGKSIKQTSASLFLHRNTINYRLVKLKELFDLDLDIIDTSHILTSCRIIQILHNSDQEIKGEK